MKAVVTTLAVALGLGVAGAAVVVYSGAVNVAADSPHWGPIHSLLETARERSVAARSADIPVPALDDVARIRSGAGNYQAMCVGCHLAPGMASSELSLGLSPTPPNLAERGAEQPARAFWVIKHGIQASAMPAWGKSMEDDYIWDMVAFIRQLPGMDAATYRAWVASSDGHSHGGQPAAASQPQAAAAPVAIQAGQAADHPHHDHGADHHH